jgi:hypothetical protein
VGYRITDEGLISKAVAKLVEDPVHLSV